MEQYNGMRTDKYVTGIPMEGCGGGFPVMKPSVVNRLHHRRLSLTPVVAIFSLAAGILDCPNMGCRGGA
jgi:hypothetical protein